MTNLLRFYEVLWTNLDVLGGVNGGEGGIRTHVRAINP